MAPRAVPSTPPPRACADGLRARLTSRVDVLDVLKAFEAGADGVAVLRCGEGNCKYIRIEPRVAARMKRGQELIKALGMDPGRVEILTAQTDAAGNPYSAACTGFSVRVKELRLRTGK